MLKKLFFIFFIRPLVILATGVHVLNREKLPQTGSFIIAANHNSHLDTFVLLSLFSPNVATRVRPVAAADYFTKNRFLSWFVKSVIGTIFINRVPKKSKTHPLQEVKDALDNNQIVIIFPEGSRGEPEKLKEFKNGISHLAKLKPNVPIVPIFLYGAGKSLPKGESVLVPFIIDVNIGEQIFMQENESITDFTLRVENAIKNLNPQNKEKL